MEPIIGLLLWSLLIGVVAVLIVDSIVITPAFHFNVLERLGKRTGKIHLEGLGLKVPLIDEVKRISMSLEPIPIAVGFTTADNAQLKLTGSLQHNPDFNIVEEDGPNKGANRYISISEKVIKEGIEDMISDVLGGLGGKYNAEDFIKSRQALGDIINHLLKFKIPYHLRHIKKHDGDACRLPDCDHSGCGVEDCKYDERVDAQDLLAFYNSHWKYLKRNSVQEEVRKKEPSSVEKRYGIRVEVFALANVDFSDEMKKALEAQKQAEARAKAFDKKIEMAQKAKTLLSASPQDALNAADVSLNPEIARNKKIVSVEGAAGVIGGLLGLSSK